MKVFIVSGAGIVGSGMLSCLMARELVDEIILQDLNMDLA